MRVSADVLLSNGCGICIALEVLLFKISVPVQLSVDIGNSFVGGFGPPNPIHSEKARLTRRPVTAP